MTGLLDSGAGGTFALAELRRLKPTGDFCFLKDEKNAPYGTKTRSELIGTVKNAVRRLILSDCDKILLACCTASTVFNALSKEEKKICIPIIYPTARAALAHSKSNKIAVISTERTHLSGEFIKAVRDCEPTAAITSLATQKLVGMVEEGVCDSNITRTSLSALRDIIAPLCQVDFDVLILGCTHFHALCGTVSEMLGVPCISSARQGAFEIMKHVKAGEGKTVYL